MYDRTVNPIPKRPFTGLTYRINTLFGITGVKMARYRPRWSEVIWAPVNVVWRPHLLSILVFEVPIHHYLVCLRLTFLGFSFWLRNWHQRTYY